MVRTCLKIIWKSCSCCNRALWSSIWHEERKSADTPVLTRRRWCNQSSRKTTFSRQSFTEPRYKDLLFQKQLDKNKCTPLPYLGYMLLNQSWADLIFRLTMIQNKQQRPKKKKKRDCSTVTQLWQGLPPFWLTAHTHGGDAAAVRYNKRTCIPLHGPPTGAVISEFCNPVVTSDI